MPEEAVGDYRVVPSGYTLQILQRRDQGWWSWLRGKPGLVWVDVIVGAPKHQIEDHLRETWKEATWETD